MRCVHHETNTNVFLYLSGHGGRIESGVDSGEYLLPVDADCASNASVARTAISGEEITETLRAIPARKVVVVFDCCHAGGIGRPKHGEAAALKAGLSENYYGALASGRGRVIIASSRETEASWILSEEAENSLFTTYLLEGLRGGVPGADGFIRIIDLFDYLQPKVTAEQPDQHPVLKCEIEENFPVALHQGGVHSPAPVSNSLLPRHDGR